MPIEIQSWLNADGRSTVAATFGPSEMVSDQDRGAIHALMSQIIERIAQRYVEERYAAIVENINAEALAGAILQPIASRLTSLLSGTANAEVVDELKMMRGVCPECGEPFLSNLKSRTPFGPEWLAALRERGVDVSSGHKNSCSRKGKL